MEALEILTTQAKNLIIKKRGRPQTMQKKAESTEEFYSKYKGKRYTAENAGLSILLEYLYQYYKENYGGAPQNELYTDERKAAILIKPYDQDSKKGRMCISGMQNLTYWLVSVHDLAFATREAARLAIDEACEDVYRIMRGNLYTDMKSRLQAFIRLFTNAEAHTQEPDIDTAFNTIDSVVIGSKAHYASTIRFAKNELCFVYAYNELIGMIADTLKIPELTVFAMNTEELEGSLTELNNTLLKYDAEATATDDFDTSHITYPPDVLPEANRANASKRIQMAMYHGFNWHEALRAIDKDYWWRVLDVNG